MGECADKQHKHPHEEEHKEPANVLVIGRHVLSETDRIEPAEVDQDSHKGTPENFDEYVCEKICFWPLDSDWTMGRRNYLLVHRYIRDGCSRTS